MRIIKQMEEVDKKSKGKRGVSFFSLHPFGYQFIESPQKSKTYEK